MLEIVEQAEAVQRFVVEAVGDGRSLYEIERGVLDRVLRIGHSAIEAALRLQGDGDLGPTQSATDGRELRRSQRPVPRRLRSIFGEHEFRQYEYSRGAHRTIDFRPIEARLGLSPRIGSYLLEEFTQLFCVESAFGLAARNFATVFHQQVPVDTLEAIARSMGAAAETYSDELPQGCNRTSESRVRTTARDCPRHFTAEARSVAERRGWTGRRHRGDSNRRVLRPWKSAPSPPRSGSASILGTSLVLSAW